MRFAMLFGCWMPSSRCREIGLHLDLYCISMILAHYIRRIYIHFILLTLTVCVECTCSSLTCSAATFLISSIYWLGSAIKPMMNGSYWANRTGTTGPVWLAFD